MGPEEKRLTRVCPYLGLPNDRASHYSDPSDAHRCYSPNSRVEIDLDYQDSFCFSTNYVTCKHFVEASEAQVPAQASTELNADSAPSSAVHSELQDAADSSRQSGHRIPNMLFEIGLWGLAIVLVIFAIYSASSVFFPLREASSVALAVKTAVSTVMVITISSPTPEPTHTRPILPTGTPRPTLQPLAIPTPPNEGTTLTLFPDTSGTGWVASKELAPHWGDRDPRVGTYQNQSFVSILRFDTANLPPDSKILYAGLELFGRNATHLGKSGEWRSRTR